MNGTRMVNEMRANHELGVLETLVLGRAYIGAGLMAADLKSCPWDTGSYARMA